MKRYVSRAVTMVAAGALLAVGASASADEVNRADRNAASVVTSEDHGVLQPHAVDGTSASVVEDSWSPELGGDGPSIAAGKPTAGTFDTIAEDPHLSGSEVSVHGCWKLGLNGSKLKGKKAKVRVWLQVKSGNSWRTIASGENDVYPGCGGGKRAKARFTCKGPQKNQFRNMVDVDVHGVIDGPARAYNIKTRACTV